MAGMLAIQAQRNAPNITTIATELILHVCFYLTELDVIQPRSTNRTLRQTIRQNQQTWFKRGHLNHNNNLEQFQAFDNNYDYQMHIGKAKAGVDGFCELCFTTIYVTKWDNFRKNLCQLCFDENTILDDISHPHSIISVYGEVPETHPVSGATCSWKPSVLATTEAMHKKPWLDVMILVSQFHARDSQYKQAGFTDMYQLTPQEWYVAGTDELECWMSTQGGMETIGRLVCLQKIRTS